MEMIEYIASGLIIFLLITFTVYLVVWLGLGKAKNPINENSLWENSKKEIK